MLSFLIIIASVLAGFTIFSLYHGIRVDRVKNFFIENYSLYTDDKFEYLIFCFWIKLNYVTVEKVVPKIPFNNYFINLFVCPLIKLVYPIYFKY